MNQSQPTKYDAANAIEKFVMENIRDIKFVKVNIGCKNCCRIFVRPNRKAKIKNFLFKNYYERMLKSIYNLVPMQSITPIGNLEIHLTLKSLVECDIQ